MLARHARPATQLFLPAALLALAIAPAACAQSCAGDLNGDGVIDGSDLGQLLAAWGPCESCAADVNANGVVDGADLGVQVGNWGECVTIPAWATVVEAQPNPDVVTDPALRAAIAAAGLAWRVRDTATQVEMLLVPPGTFLMGCVMGSDAFGCFAPEQPVHQVTLTNAFYIGRYEVTQAQWRARMGSNPSSYQGSTRPVDSVSWNLIQGFLSATGLRLPTEAEWEFACRAGTQTPFYNGSTVDAGVAELAWCTLNTCSGSSGCGSREVGLKAANGFGIHDMLGNVWEWVNDWNGGYTNEAQTNPTGPSNASTRVIRGGGWNVDSHAVRSSFRGYGTPGGSGTGIGFRVARTP
jgi:formylglycine-generating enzyme required for sulfatase activity